MKKIIMTTMIAFLSIFSAPKAEAGMFNSMIANPFVFCSLPKPCKFCQPFRSIWSQICPAGQPSAQEKSVQDKALSDLAKVDPIAAQQFMTADKFRTEMGKASLSAFSEDTQYIKEVSDWIAFQSNQVIDGKKVSEMWCDKGIDDPLNNASLRQTAYNDIVSKNKKIVETISNGYMPPKNSKPWYDTTTTLVNSCPNRYSSGN